MIVIGLVLIGLAIIKEYEPTLLLPIGFGCVLANLGMSSYQTMTVTEIVNGQITEVVRPGFLKVIYDMGITTELFPLLIFIGVGAMIDFRPLLAMPKMVILGAAGQFGIYGTLIFASFLAKFIPSLGWGLPEAASIGTIGAIDGPTAIYVTSKNRTTPARLRRSLFLHEPDPDHSTSDHEGYDLKSGSQDSYGICAETRIPSGNRGVPDVGYDRDQHHLPAAAP